MTASFTALCAAGSGKLDFELRIEGLSKIFVSDEGRASLSDASGRTRVPGLQAEGLGFGERVYLPGAELDVSIDEVKIDEVPGAWLGSATSLFSTIAARVGTLTATLLAGDVTANVLDSSVFPNGYYYIGTETIQVTARPTGTTITIVRGRYESTAQEHPVSAGEDAIATDIYDAPTGMATRRVWLYAICDDETATETTTVIWRGLLAREPTLSEDTLTWSFGVESRAKALDASLAGGLDKPFNLRGIYYPGVAPLVIQVRRYTTASMDTVDADVGPLTLSGFWETQREFTAALETLLNGDATISTWGVTFFCEDLGEHWELYVTVAAASPKYISLYAGSRVDGIFSGALGRILSNRYAEDSEARVIIVTAGATYHCNRLMTAPSSDLIPYAEQRLVPRLNSVGFSYTSTEADIAAYPRGRVYLDRLGSLSTGDDLVVVPQYQMTGAGTPAPFPDGEAPAAGIFPILSVTAASGYVTVDPHPAPAILASGGIQPTITAAARYASGDASVEGFRTSLLSRAPAVANRGQGPWVTSDDLASWETVVTEAAAGRAWLLHRVYSFVKPVKAIDVLREEWKLLGVFPRLDADAKLSVRPLTIDTASSASVAITASSLLQDESLGGVSGDADGLVNTVELLRGYDPVEDKHVERNFIFRGMSALVRVHAERKLEIAPKARAVGDEPEWEDVYDTAARLIAFFGTRRVTSVKFETTLVNFAVLVGDWIELTIEALPFDGTRAEWTSGGGITAKRALVIGRSWDLSTGVGRFEVLMPEAADNAAGYAPSCRVNSAAGAGTAWTLTVEQTYYAESGNDTAHFVAGQSIRLIEFDAVSPTIREGYVASVSATTVGVTLSAVWAGMGGATYYVICYDTSDDADTTASQLLKAYLAASTGRIPLASGTQAARDLAP